MKKIIVEEVVKVERYKAIDDMVFPTIEECRKHDREVNDNNIAFIVENCKCFKSEIWYPYANIDDYGYYVVKLDNDDIVRMIKQCLEYGSCLNEDTDRQVDEAFHNNESVLVEIYQYDNALYFIGTKNYMIKSALDNYNKIFDM